MGERKNIPKSVRERVLAEFSHRCAICAADRPQLHHIDENPANSDDPFNIIPLCPNCHLTDQHNPTAPVDPRKLSLFRQYKDPAILKPQFHPIFRRLLFLDSISDELPAAEIQRKSRELVDFISTLEMGAFYGPRLDVLLRRKQYMEFFNLSDDPYEQQLEREKDRKRDQEYREQICQCRNEVEALVIEQLRYQRWESESAKGHKGLT